MYKMLIFVLLILVILTIPVFANAADYPEFTDTSGVSDETFFGVWDISSSVWTTTPQLDYSKHSGLSKVESAVKSGNYALAKTELLEYFKNRQGITYPKTPHSSSSDDTNFWSLRDSMAFTDKYITDTDINSSDFATYTIDLGNNANGGRFLLSSLQKSTDMIEITSRESSNPPILEIECTSGQIIRLTPEKDTYIRAGVYKDESYGKETSLYIKDDYTLSGTKYIPYSDNTRRAYVFFDNDKIPSSGIKSVKLVLNARLVPEKGSLTDKSVNLVVVNPYNKSWNEYTGTSALPLMTWANYKVAHYSWQGLPGGILWERPDNVPSEFFNANTRFTQMSSLASLSLAQSDESLKKEYMYKSMELTLDFIRDSAGKISNGVPNKRDIESANRCHEFSALYNLYLNSGFINPDANAAMLKWLYQEAEYLYQGAGILYEGPNSTVTSNNYANTNRGVWHTMGFLACVGYFPEFKKSSSWENVLNARIKKVVDIIIADDGCYLEPTFGYPGAVINFFNAMMQTWENTSKTPDENLSKKLNLLARYLMYTGYPNGNPPRFGENFGSARNTIKSIKNYDKDSELVYYVTGGTSGNKPAVDYAKFDLLKIVTDRTGWSASDSMIFINAKNGGNHNHKDSLSLTMYSGGREILEDTGMTSYDGEYPSFDWQRHQTKSHNTVEIDGTPQRGSNFLDDNGDSDINIISDKSSSFIRGWTDATEGFRHKRNVLWFKNFDFALVNDDITPPDSQEHTYAQNWHVYSGYSSNPYIENDFTGKTAYESGTQLIISQADTSNVTYSIEKGYSAISSDMTDYFNYKKTVSGNGGFSTVLVPVKNTDNIKVRSRSLDVQGDADAKATKINLDKNDRSYEITAYTSYGEKGVWGSFENMSTDCLCAYAVYEEDGSVLEASICKGTGIYKNGKPLFCADSDIEKAFFTVENSRIMINCKDEDANRGFVLSGDIKADSVYINGNKVNYSLLGDSIYVNYDYSFDAQYGGTFGDGRFFWGYDSSSGMLRIYGSGELNVYNQNNYTSRPWQEFADEIEYVYIDTKITSADMYTFSHMPIIDKVWCGEEFFAIQDGYFSQKNSFAGNCTYICSSGTVTDGISFAEWYYEPEYTDNGFMGVLTVSETDKTEKTVDWNHIRFDKLNIFGVKNINYTFESECLSKVYIQGASSIGERVFANCPSLCNVVIAEGISSVGKGAFALSEKEHCLLNVNLPLSIISIDSPFEGRGNENIQLYGYPDTESEDFAKNNSFRFEYITEGKKENLYSWSYDEDKGYLKIDFEGDIPSKLSDMYDDIITTYEAYITEAKILHLGNNVTSVPADLFDSGNIETVYCPETMFEHSYKIVADVGDALYTDENGNQAVYPATVEIDGKIVPTHNADIKNHIKIPFAGEGAVYKSSGGTFVSYSKTSSPYTIKHNGTIEWEFDPLSSKLTINCTDGESIGNVSVRTSAYYPWRDVAAGVKVLNFADENISDIGKYAFSGMALEEITLPHSIQNIYMRAFHNCKNLRQVNFNSGLQKIHSYCFTGCTSLESVYIPDNISTVDSKAFYKTGAEIICTVGTFGASCDFYNTDTSLHKKRVLSKLSYDDGKIKIICGSDNSDMLVKAYYVTDENGVAQLVKSVTDDVKLTKDTVITIDDTLSDIPCDYVKIMLTRNDNKLCPDSKMTEIKK